MHLIYINTIYRLIDSKRKCAVSSVSAQHKHGLYLFGQLGSFTVTDQPGGSAASVRAPHWTNKLPIINNGATFLNG